MIDFVKALQKEVQRDIDRLEQSKDSVIKKSLEASHILGAAFDRLKQFIVAYDFKDETEEIAFFKEIKPRLFSKLIYYRKLYNIEMMRPAGSADAQKDYLNGELEAIAKYTAKRIDFYRYVRSGATHLDRKYFLRGQTDTEQYLESLYYELDPQFSTNCDFKAARIMANDMLTAYLVNEIEMLA